MATQSKAQFLTDVYTLLKRRYKPKADRNAARLSVLKAVVYGICHEDTTREQANQALSRFKDEFFDWNEVRVSSARRDPGEPRRHPRPRGAGPAHPPVPPPALQPDLRLHPRRPDQEAAEGSPQGPPDLRGLRVGLTSRPPSSSRRWAATPSRSTRTRTAHSSGWGSPSRASRSSAPSWSAPSPRTAAPSSST